MKTMDIRSLLIDKLSNTQGQDSGVALPRRVDQTLDLERDCHTKVGIKSYGSALVKVRWNFSDQALWIGLRSLNFSEGRHYANRWLD